MTRDEILLRCLWPQARLEVHSPFFGRTVSIMIDASIERVEVMRGPILPPDMVQAVNDFLNLREDDRPLMQRLLHRHCASCCEDISYGFDPLPGETEVQANRREFGVATDADALAQANLKWVRIEDNADSGLKGRYVLLQFDTPWESEHGCQLVLKDGKLLDHMGESGDSLYMFED
ncbi:DUF6985 domain-containing protein [Corallococcus aberystwythensis]|uniref:DUF6985 domain-containing protein n=1 Tax=Corallococcus aberystwythensis TaxID=2316722 RepID=A0A3A8QQB6_9BACT|nr:hypothetical protein [Corallococcus aberystwythensis]RKH70966.1 hypothetical protein D7W81_08440 [Corallococcus aberystwythensis]